MGRQVFSNILESRGPTCTVGTWEEKCHHSESLLLSPFSPCFVLSMRPWCLLGPAVPALSPPNSCPIVGGMGWGTEKTLSVCELCLAITKTSLNYQHSFQHESKDRPQQLPWRKLYPEQKQHASGGLKVLWMSKVYQAVMDCKWGW